MTTTRFLLTLLHLLGMALATGAAAVKVALLLGARADSGLTAVYLRVVKPVTRLLVTGLVLATATGAAWLVLGRPITAAVAGKLVLAAALWVLGPVIDKVVEPRFVRLAPAPGGPATPEFARARFRYVTAEVVATGLLGGLTVLGVLA